MRISPTVRVLGVCAIVITAIIGSSYALGQATPTRAESDGKPEAAAISHAPPGGEAGRRRSDGVATPRPRTRWRAAPRPAGQAARQQLPGAAVFDRRGRRARKPAADARGEGRPVRRPAQHRHAAGRADVRRRSRSDVHPADPGPAAAITRSRRRSAWSARWSRSSRNWCGGSSTRDTRCATTRGRTTPAGPDDPRRRSRPTCERTNDAIHAAVPGDKISYFRQPGGAWTASIVVAKPAGHDVAALDGRPAGLDAARCGQHQSTVNSGTARGSIVLHARRRRRARGTVSALRSILPNLKRRFAARRAAARDRPADAHGREPAAEGRTALTIGIVIEARFEANVTGSIGCGAAEIADVLDLASPPATPTARTRSPSTSCCTSGTVASRPAVHLLVQDSDGTLAGYAHVDTTDKVDGAAAELVVDPRTAGTASGGRWSTAAIDARRPPVAVASPVGARRPPVGRRAGAVDLGFTRARVLFQMRRSLFAPLPERDAAAGRHPAGLRAGPRRAGLGAGQRPRLRTPPRPGPLDHRRPADPDVGAVVRPGRLPARGRRPSPAHSWVSTGPRCTGRTGTSTTRSARCTWSGWTRTHTVVGWAAR